MIEYYSDLQNMENLLIRTFSIKGFPIKVKMSFDKLSSNLTPLIRTLDLHNLKKIIYIDDQTDILLIAEYALTKLGKYDALMCKSGAEALAKIDDYNPDLILLDGMMPELSGPETLSKIREKTLFKDTPAIFVTAKIFPSEVAELMSCNTGIIDVISKPFDPTTISESIQSAWDSSFSKEYKESSQ